MKIYNAIGFSIIAAHVIVSGLFAPPELGFGFGAIVGILYLLFIWFFGGVYLSDVIHMGIAHRTLDYKEGFIKFLAVFYNTAGIYINPVSWVNRHRHHHAFSDHDGDPNKLDEDGFWKTLYLCIFPYECRKDLATDQILQSFPIRFVSNRYFAVFSQISSYGLLWLIVRDWKFAAVLWLSVRIFALWINMIQNYWTHDRKFGTRRYTDEHDNAMNLGEWLPVTASFSASLQNNHHHFPRFLRTSHDENEYDFGLMTVRLMKALRLVEGSSSGKQKPDGIPLQDIGF
ncbi:MAG: fatty acid desaturase [Pyrinomonadaceae bacterium]